MKNLMLNGNCLSGSAWTERSVGVFLLDGELRCDNVVFYECGTAGIEMEPQALSDLTFHDIQNCRFIRCPKYSFRMYTSQQGETAEVDSFRLSGCRMDGARDIDDWIDDWPGYDPDTDEIATLQQILIQQGRMMSVSKNVGTTCGTTETAKMIQIERNAQHEGLYTDMVSVRANMCLDQTDVPGTEMIRVYMGGTTTPRPFRGVLCMSNLCEALDSFTDGAEYRAAQMIHIRSRGYASSALSMYYVIVYGNVSGPAHTAFYCGSGSVGLPTPANHVGFIGNLSFRAEPNTNPGDTQSFCCVFEGEPDGDTVMKYGMMLGNVYGDSRAATDSSERAFALRNEYVEYCSMLANIATDTQYSGIWDSGSLYSDVSHNIGGFIREI